VFKTLVDTEVARTSVEVAVQEAELKFAAASANTKLDIYKTDAAVFKTLVDTETARTAAEIAVQDAELKFCIAAANNKTAMYKTDADVFQTLTQAESARTSAEIAVQAAELNYHAKVAELKIEVAKANLGTMLAQTEMFISSQEKTAALLAQVAASIGGAVGYHSGISATTTLENKPFTTAF
jgi:hypothetical protein